MNVSHAFHSELVAPAATALRDYLDRQRFEPLAAHDGLHRHRRRPAGRHRRCPSCWPGRCSTRCGSPRRWRRWPTGVDLLLEVGPGDGAARPGPRHRARRAGDLPGRGQPTRWPGCCTRWVPRIALGAPCGTEVLYRAGSPGRCRWTRSSGSSPAPAEAAPEWTISAGAAVTAVPLAGTPGRGPPGRSQRAEVSLRRTVSTCCAGSPPSEPSCRCPRSGRTASRWTSCTSARSRWARSSTRPPVSWACRPRGDLGLRHLHAGRAGRHARRARRHRHRPRTSRRSDGVPGVGPWVRAFAVDLVPARGAGRGRVAGRRRVAGCSHRTGTRSRPSCTPRCVAARLGDGVLLCLPADCDETAPAHDAGRRARRAVDQRLGPVRGRRRPAGRGRAGQDAAPGDCRRCHHGRHPAARGCDRPTGPPDGVADRRGCRGHHGFSEVVYDGAGARHVPMLRPLQPWTPTAPRRRSATRTCCWSPAAARASPPSARWPWPRDTGAAVGLLGRSDPATRRRTGGQPGPDDRGRGPPPLRPGGRDLGADEVKAAVQEIGRTLGPVTAVLHGAGRNEPTSLAEPGRGRLPAHAGPEGRRPGGRAGRDRPGDAAAAGHLRQHHRPGRPARRGATTPPPTTG